MKTRNLQVGLHVAYDLNEANKGIDSTGDVVWGLTEGFDVDEFLASDRDL